MAESSEKTPKFISIDTTIKDSGFLSFIPKYLNYDTYTEFVRDYSRLEKDDPLTLSIRSHGGDANYSLMIAKMILDHPAKTRVVIDRIAASGATIIALMADEIAMTPNATLGAIDVQMFLPIKSIIPTACKYKENSIICGIIYDICNGYQENFIDKLRSLFRIKYPNHFEQIIDFFYFKYSHSIPIFKSDLPGFLNVTSLDLEVSAPYPNFHESSIQNLMSSFTGQPGNTQPEEVKPFKENISIGSDQSSELSSLD